MDPENRRPGARSPRRLAGRSTDSLAREGLLDPRHRHVEGVQGHRHERVEADRADELHETLLAEARDGSLVQVERQVARLVQAASHVVDEALVLGRALGPALLEDLVDRRLSHAELERQAHVRDPLDVAAPRTPGDQDRQLDQPPLERGALPDEVPQTHRAPRQLGAANPRVERAADLAVGARGANLRDLGMALALFGGQLFGTLRGESAHERDYARLAR